MNKDEIKGKMKEVEGRVQQKVGEWTGSKENQVKGVGKQAEGKLQEGVGKLKDAGREAADNLRDLGKPKKENELPEEEYQDARNRKDVKSDVVPNRDDEIGEEVA
ncbi:MAG TPA: CsbD family protein [Terriglobales bacterium]|nr:CsbD family protein [Terriglobales bacterium]